MKVTVHRPSTSPHSDLVYLLVTGLAFTQTGCGPHQRSATGNDKARVTTPVPARNDARDATASTPPDRVTGTVLDLGSYAPLAGRTVAIGGRKTITDAKGTFVFDGVPPVYDATIAEPGGITATRYLGLSRRDPILAHQHVAVCKTGQRLNPLERGGRRGRPFCQVVSGAPCTLLAHHASS
jgi:hypothetical protein